MSYRPGIARFLNFGALLVSSYGKVFMGVGVLWRSCGLIGEDRLHHDGADLTAAYLTPAISGAAKRLGMQLKLVLGKGGRKSSVLVVGFFTQTTTLPARAFGSDFENRDWRTYLASFVS